MKRKEVLRKISLMFLLALAATTFTFSFVACNQNPADKQNETSIQTATFDSISEQEVLAAQAAWGDGIVKIGKVYLENGDFKTAALNHINEFYGYDQGTVLFKPTLTSQKQFRTDLQGALSYFVSGDESYPEDHGFAIKPWSNVRWESVGIKIIGNMAVAMGNYYFTPAKGGDEVKVEYSFAYSKDDSGKLKILLHDSHLPYKPEEKH
jgi:hypothetical protein